MINPQGNTTSKETGVFFRQRTTCTYIQFNLNGHNGKYNTIAKALYYNLEDLKKEKKDRKITN